MNDTAETMPQVWVASEAQWVRAKDAKKIFGVGRGMLNDWVAEGKVMARCADKAVFYRFADIERMMNSLRRWMPKVSGDCVPRSPAKAGQASGAEGND